MREGVGCKITNAAEQGLELVYVSGYCDICEMLTSYLQNADTLSRSSPGKRSKRAGLTYLACQL